METAKKINLNWVYASIYSITVFTTAFLLALVDKSRGSAIIFGGLAVLIFLADVLYLLIKIAEKINCLIKIK